MLKNVNTVWILGSGVSSVCGLPTFSNFKNKANIIIERNHNDIPKQIIDVFHIWVSKFPDYTIEDLYSLVELKSIIAKNENKNEILTKESIIDFIEYVLANSYFDKPSRAYSGFVGDNIYYSYDVVLNFNWDTCLEYEAYNYNKQMHKPPIDSPFSKMNYGYKDIVCLNEEQNNFDPFHFEHFKLHGSLNWGYCSDCNKIYYDNNCKPNQLFDLKCPKHNLKLERYIIPPTVSKINESQKYVFLKHIWNKAYDRLKNTKYIIIVGYSFPKTDIQFRLFFIDSINSNENLDYVGIVSKHNYPQDEIYHGENIKQIFSNTPHSDKVGFYSKGFSRFVEDLRIRGPASIDRWVATHKM